MRIAKVNSAISGIEKLHQ
jgi:ketosteroid isomerase-like protein